MVLKKACHVLHAAITYFNVICIKQLVVLMVFWEVLVKESQKYFANVCTLLLIAGLNHKMFLLRFLLLGGCGVNFIFLLKPLFLSALLRDRGSFIKPLFIT